MSVSKTAEKNEMQDPLPEVELSIELDDDALEELGMDFNVEVSRKAAAKPMAEKSLRKAQKAARAGDWPKTAKYLLAAWDAAPNDLSLLTLLAHSLVQLGVREKAIEVLERALKYHAPTADICAIMLEMAVKMEMYDVAIKIGHQLIALDPDTATHYVNIASAYSGAERYDEGIEMLQAVLPKFPEHGDLWNVLGTTVRMRDGIDASYVFLDEALRVEPNNYKALSNYAQSLIFQLKFDRALEMDKRAMQANPANPEAFIGAAQLQFYFGQLASAWGNYERRLDAGRKLNQSQIYTHKIPKWQGEDLTGKSLLVAGEQGIGDEVMFGAYLPFLYDQADKLYIGCDHRLISIYQRRFPKATVVAYRDGIMNGYRYRAFPEIETAISKGEISVDFSIEVASCPRYAWHTIDDVKPHPDGYLTPDPDLDKTFKKRLDDISDKPKVGISWRSGNVSGLRAGGYASIEMMGPVFARKDEVDFVNLQYGECSEELKYAKEHFGVDVIQFEDIDLKRDIEANLAIMNNCSLVLAAVSAPAIFSLAVGAKTVFLAPHRPWWSFGDSEKIPFAPNATFLDLDPKHGWEEVVEFVAAKAWKDLGLSG